MPKIITLQLSSEQRVALDLIVKKGENWRERERATTLLLLDDGFSVVEVAEKLGLHKGTVSSTRRAWFESGFDSLPDKPRCGAPRKLSDEQVRRLVELAAAQPLSAAALMNKLQAEGAPRVHVNTLTSTLKAAAVVWKRTRHSLKKNETTAKRLKPPIAKRSRSSKA